MNVILLQNLDNLGYKHDLVKVKNGYGRNFLIPKGMAVIASDANMAKLDKLKAEEAAKEATKVGEYKAMAEQLEGKTLSIPVKAGTSGKIFGSVTNVQIANALKEQLDMDIDRRKIVLDEEVKELGTFTATINFYTDVVAKIPFELKKD